MFSVPVLSHTLSLNKSTLIITRPSPVETCQKNQQVSLIFQRGLELPLAPLGKGKASIILWAHTVPHCYKPYQNWPDNDWMMTRIQLTSGSQHGKGVLTKEKWEQLPCHPAIIYFKTLLKFSFSPAPPPSSGLIKSAGSSAALSHTVLERHPPSYYQVQPCDLKLWFCSNDNKGEPRADAPNSSFPAW